MIVPASGNDRPVLITGATGFAGGYLAEALLATEGDRIVGLARRAQWPEAWRHLTDRVDLRACDLCDSGHVEALLREVNPGRIFHLAGYAQVGRSFHEPEEAWQGNLTATRALLQACDRWGGRPRVLWVGSGLVYGSGQAPVRGFHEECLLLPDTPYAASKAAADLVAYQCARHPGLVVVRARPFNHIGPRQQPGFALTDFARQLVEIERGDRPPVLETGNLRPLRDLTDVRDTVAAYLLLMERGRSGEAYNIGRGESVAMSTLLERLVALSGRQVEVRQRADLVRSHEPEVLRVDATKLRRETGWAPRFTLDQTLSDTLAYWRGRVAQEGRS